MEKYAIEMLNITKRFPGIIANDNITLQLKYGEIHALLGENGAGKSTLMSVLFGLYQPEEGEILVDGIEAKITGPRKANELGIGMVHQHFMQIKNFTVLENIILGVETTKGGVLQMDEARKKVVELSEQYGLKIDPDAYVRDITVGMQQRVEILKMLYRDCKVLIFDEPTAVLTPQEIDDLMKIMDNLRKEGKAIMFITHKLEEIKAVSDRVTVLRLGKYIGSVETKNATIHDLAEMMVGREVNFHVDKAPQKLGEPLLSVKHLKLRNERNADKFVINDVSFDVRAGEILCVAGIEGNGQSELVKVIAGLLQQDAGQIILNGEDITNATRRQRINKGLSYVPEDRHKHGLILDYNLEENLALKRYFLPEMQKGGIIDFKQRKQHADKLINEFDIRTSEGAVTITRSMSGGNQQKAIVAREIDADHSVLVAIQPTRGLDVGAIEGIHKNLVAQRDAGKAVLLVSFELEEVMGVSDRIIVFYEGEIVADVRPEDISVNELGLYMAGSKREEKK